MKPKTQELPGEDFQRKKIKAIEEAASEYVIARDKRMELTKKESETKTKLSELMKKHSLKVYRFEDGDDMREVTVKSTEKLKVKKVGEEDAPEDSENEND